MRLDHRLPAGSVHHIRGVTERRENVMFKRLQRNALNRRLKRFMATTEPNYMHRKLNKHECKVKKPFVVIHSRVFCNTDNNSFDCVVKCQANF